MIRFPQTTLRPRHLLAALAGVIFVAAIHSGFAGPLEDSAQIECTTPDGQVMAVSTAPAAPAEASLSWQGNQLRHALGEGQTTFVIKLPSAATRDGFAFVNENATAVGALKIFVSDSHLPAGSDQWIAVDGKIPFANKRLFNLSLVGVDARYVKLAFTVDKPTQLAAR